MSEDSWPPARIQATPLLKFANADEGNETAYLDPDGLKLFDSLPDSSVLCPIILMGDGRGGKSYLSSRILGVPDAFVSNDTAEPVTEGIDMIIAPVAPLLRDAGLPMPAEQQHMLLLDCEGGNNAMAEIRTLVNVFGTLIGTVVVFVASGMASEQSLQTLGTTLAARSLIKLGSETTERLQQQLVFVVNKNTLRYDDGAFEQILQAKYKGPRKELRDSIQEAFLDRLFCTVPLMGTPDFEESAVRFRKTVLENRRPLIMGGIPVRKNQIKGLLELIVSEVQRTNEINFPSVNRYVVLEGFLLPLAKELGGQANNQLPRVEDYDADLQAKDSRKQVLAKFDQQTCHVCGHSELVKEARHCLQQMLDSAWEALERKNEALGDEIVESTTESRHVTVSVSDPSPLGGTGLLKNLLVRTQVGKMEMRSRIRRRRGCVEFSDWKSAGMETKSLVETCLDGYEKLPQHEERLWKKSPHRAAHVISLGLGLYHDRLCLLRDCVFFWYDVVDQDDEGNAVTEDCGCLNFLLQNAEIVADDNSATSFTIRPADIEGWTEPHTFSGGPKRSFTFDCGDSVGAKRTKAPPRPLSSDLNFRRVTGALLDNICCRPGCKEPDTERCVDELEAPANLQAARQRRDDWIAALRRHASFGNEVMRHMGREAVLKAFGEGKRKYALEEVRSGWD